MTRVGTLAENNQILQYIDQNKSQADTIEQQLATGLTSQTFSGMAPQATQFVELTDQASQQQSYISTINTVTTTMQTMALAIQSIEGLAAQFAGNLPAQAYNTQGETIQEQAKLVLQQVGGYLNTQDGSDYVFSGSATSQPAFSPSGLPSPGSLTTSVGGAPPNGYYQGNSTVAQATIDNGVTLSYGITGNNPAFEQFVRVLNFLANSPPFDPNNPTDAANVATATDMINQSVGQLQSLEGTVSLQQGELSGTLSTHQSALTLAQSTISNVEQVDPAAAITQLDTLQTQLQASYQTVGILQQLSLVNYLK